MNFIGEGEVKNFTFIVRQWRGRMLTICTMGLGKNEGVHLHVHRSSITLFLSSIYSSCKNINNVLKIGDLHSMLDP
jgi:hypothetical protein